MSQTTALSEITALSQKTALSETATPTNQASVLDEFVPVDAATSFVTDLINWAQVNLLSLDVGLQIGLIVSAIIPAALFGHLFRDFVHKNFADKLQISIINRLFNAIAVISGPIIVYITLTVINIGLASADQPTQWVGAAIALMNAWIIVRLVTLVIQSPFWSSFAFYVAWPIAALDAFGALGPIVAEMQALAIPLGTNDQGQPVDISLLDVVKTLVYFGLLFAGANFVSKIIQERIEQIEELNPAIKALFTKILNIVLPIIALLIAFHIVGFNITTLAVFSGAVGLGVGLGLQRSVANFVAGFTLLVDRSIKPGDVIEIEDQMGWVTAMQSRYVALLTRDGTELLIPNDRFMGEGVVNWSRSHDIVRLHAPFHVSYATEDLASVIALAIQTAAEVPRVLEEPVPDCNITGFGEGGIQLDLGFWIGDPKQGVGNVRGEVLLKLWQNLRASGIEIPRPQQEILVTNGQLELKPPAL